jgi:hypothetical protein
MYDRLPIRSHSPQILRARIFTGIAILLLSSQVLEYFYQGLLLTVLLPGQKERQQRQQQLPHQQLRHTPVG